MKKGRKELIKRLHDGAWSGIKKEIEKEFPKLFKEEALVVGKWYKYRDNCIDALMVWNDSEDTYGFWRNKYRTELSFDLINDKIPATDKEVEQALIKEAKKRGLKTSNHSCLEDGAIWNNITGSEYRYYPKENKLMIGASTVFLDGKWATIVETITKEQAEKELGKTILN
tara:strand:- start:279 stop:788 length:510 start_codon:yes stop_codon:yes gene_type:complete